MEYLIIMWLCSTVPGNECKQLPTEITEFKSHYDCAIYGYKSSVTTIESFDKDGIDGLSEEEREALKDDLQKKIGNFIYNTFGI